MDENEKKMIDAEWEEEDKKKVINQNLTREERKFIQELIYMITMQRSVSELKDFLKKNDNLIKNSASKSLIDEIYIISQKYPDMRVNALFYALVMDTQSGNYDITDLLIENGANLKNFTRKLFEKPSSTPAAEPAPEQVEKNWKDKMKEGLEKMKFWKKTEQPAEPVQQAGKRRTKKQRKSRKQRK
jgi:hypothetical protein